MVRDQDTGETKKLSSTDLIQSGQQVFTTYATLVELPEYLSTFNLQHHIIHIDWQRFCSNDNNKVEIKIGVWNADHSSKKVVYLAWH